MIAGAPPGSRIAVAGINLSADTIEPAQAILKELDLRFGLFYSPEAFAQTPALLSPGSGSGRADIMPNRCQTRRQFRK